MKNSLYLPALTVPSARKRTRQPRPSDSHPRSHEAVQCLSALRTHRRYRRSVRTSHTHIALIHICVGHGEHCDAPIYGPLLSNRLQGISHNDFTPHSRPLLFPSFPLPWHAPTPDLSAPSLDLACSPLPRGLVPLETSRSTNNHSASPCPGGGFTHVPVMW